MFLSFFASLRKKDFNRGARGLQLFKKCVIINTRIKWRLKCAILEIFGANLSPKAE